jgi:hypothetical protein
MKVLSRRARKAGIIRQRSISVLQGSYNGRGTQDEGRQGVKERQVIEEKERAAALRGQDMFCKDGLEGRLSNGRRSIQLRYPLEVIATTRV